MEQIESGLWNVMETATYLRVSEDTVYNLSKPEAGAKRLPVIYIGKSRRFRKADLDRFIEDQVESARTR
jgi:excisionase family DNA binding protein